MPRSAISLAFFSICSLQAVAVAARHDGELTLRVLDEQTRQPIVARMELRNGRGRPVKVRAEGIVSHDDYFAFEGEVTLKLKKGTYQFLIEAGPEYRTRPGSFTIERQAEDSKEVTLRRVVNMPSEGWWAGDLDVRHRHQELPLLMRAAHVDVVPSIVSENIQGKCKKYTVDVHRLWRTHGSLDYRRGGGLLFFKPALVDVSGEKSNGPSLPLIETVKDANLVALTPFAWDLPLWVATGKLDAVQIIHRHALADSVVDNEGWGRKRDKTFFPGKTGNGRWSEVIYHHLLNCGLHIPPAAGSGSGTNKSPIGTNRIYVHCGDDFSEERWWSGLRAGQVMVTNGPLLRTTVSGKVPGHEFQLDAGESRDFQIGLDLAFYEKSPVEYLEIIKNGQVIHNIRLNELAKQKGRLPRVHFERSGWFLVRAVTSTTKNHQFASTGPYYVKANYQPRISRKSVQFFLDWIEEAEQEFIGNQTVLQEINAAKPFWQTLLEQANSD